MPQHSNAWHHVDHFTGIPRIARRYPVWSRLLEPRYLKAKRSMPKFAIGDVVDKDKTHSGTVIAVFMTVEGEQRYAVDMEGYGALQFIMECNLIPHETPQ